MLHAVLQGHWSIGSREEDFFKVFTIYGHGGHLGHVTRTVYTTFRFPDPWRLHMKFGYIGPVVSEEKSFEIVDGRRRTTEPAYIISCPGAFGSGELKMKISIIPRKNYIF